MKSITNQLSKISSDSDNTLENVEIDFDKFKEVYSTLGDLKKFRAGYEKQNVISRWWNNDKLRDKQLDSLEVQGEFSQMIGQLMLISIVQSKELKEQQIKLNEQQEALKTQAGKISAQTNKIQTQQVTLADQSDELEKLVKEYFSLKGLTEDGAKKLIEIATEIKETKNSMVKEFDVRSKAIEVRVNELNERSNNLFTGFNKKIADSADYMNSNLERISVEVSQSLENKELAIIKKQEIIKAEINQKAIIFEKQIEKIQNDFLEKNLISDFNFKHIFNQLRKLKIGIGFYSFVTAIVIGLIIYKLK